MQQSNNKKERQQQLFLACMCISDFSMCIDY